MALYKFRIIIIM